MEGTITSILVISLTAVSLVRSDLFDKPENGVAIAGSTATLRCTVAPSISHRVIWWEFNINQQGFTISDGRDVVPSHPNAARYSIGGTGDEYHLQIHDVRVEDGGRYRCSDYLASPPNFQGDAELIVLGSQPVCEEWNSVSGVVLEGRSYSSWCGMYYRGRYAPNISWTGPGTFDVIDVTTDEQVWSQSTFVAHRSVQGMNFMGTTRFMVTGPFPPDSAANNPDYTYVFTGQTLNVNWAPTPETMVISPIKSFYDVGDVLTCLADSNPVPSYTWTNIRTQISSSGPTFQVTSDLLGTTQIMRCGVTVMIEGQLSSADAFVNTTVLALTTTPMPTTPAPTTTPAADGPCRLLTGHWSATNPSANLCIDVDSKGNVLVLVRNGTALFFVVGNGKTVYDDYSHVGFTVIYPGVDGGPAGPAGFAGECHNCYGNEVLLMSGISRSKERAPACGVGSTTQLTNLYVMTRNAFPCLPGDSKVYKPSQRHIEAFGISPKRIMSDPV